MLTEYQKHQILQTINTVFLPPGAVEVAGESEEFVQIKMEDGRIEEWKKEDLL